MPNHMIVAEVQGGGRLVSREGRQVVKERELYPMPAVRVLLLHRRQVGLGDSCEILDIHCSLLALLVCQAMFLCKLPQDLKRTHANAY